MSTVLNEGYVSDRVIASVNNYNPMRDTFNASDNVVFNPDAKIIKLGVAQNDLMREVLKEKVSASLSFDSTKDFGYGDPHGSKKLRELVAGLINRNFEPKVPLESDHILTTTGAGAAVFFLTLGITNPGDSVLVVSPYYGNFDSDVCVGSQVHNIPFYPSPTDDGCNVIEMDQLEEVYEDAAQDNKKIKAILLTNPHNPFGNCFSKESLENLLKFASKHTLHVVSDEVYALSTFSHILDEKKENPFISILKLETVDELIDPALVHVIYSFSKDLCLNGFRVGFIIDQHNDFLRQYLKTTALFSFTSSIMDRLLRNMLEDKAWVDSFFAINQRRIADAYIFATQLLDKHGLKYIPAEAGQFIMVDATSHPKIHSIDDEKSVFVALLEQGVYIAPGHIFHTRKPGYFRLTFTLDRQKLETGIVKLAQVLEQF